VKVLSIVGNRPQFIKAAPVSIALREAGIDEAVLDTGQHYDAELSQIFFDELGLEEPAYRLELHTADPNLMQPGIADALARERPDWALVYGDTNSTLAGARAAAEAGVPIAHVEAGLRSGDLSMPEEHTRVEVDRLAQLLLCPDKRARETLEGEGVSGRIEVIGDVMHDVSLRMAAAARTRSDVLRRFGLEPGGYLVATVHREANVGPGRLTRIAEGLNRLAEPVLFTAHPRTRAVLADLQLELAPHIQLAPPLGYLDLAALASQARVILTDSGGLQKEAYWYGVPCVTLRPSTEWVDTVELGANRLVDDDPGLIVAAVAEARFPEHAPQLYGDGHAAERLAQALYSLLPL
jgi:UDP-N-acetylglucosamine 2-epimerase